MGADPLAAVDALGDAIHHAHAKDTALNDAAHNWRACWRPLDIEMSKLGLELYHSGLRHGDQWWRAFCYRLRLNGYDGWLSIEHEDMVLSRIEGLRKSVELLKHASIEEASDYRIP